MGIKEKGFTLIEAMVTLTVFSLLLAFAKPSVQGIYNRMSVTATTSMITRPTPKRIICRDAHGSMLPFAAE